MISKKIDITPVPINRHHVMLHYLDIETVLTFQIDIEQCDLICQYCVCCSVLQCVAVCCSVLQCVAVCCSVSKRHVSLLASES